MTEADSPRRTETVVNGIPVSTGVGVGPLFVFAESFAFDAPAYCLMPEAIAPEVERLKRAIVAAKDDLDHLRAEAALKVGEQDARIFLLHRQMLDDSSFQSQIERGIREDKINAEAAVSAVVSRLSDAFARLEDEIARDRATDIRDVGRLVMRNLGNRDPSTLVAPGEKYVLVTRELFPSDAANLDKDRLAAIVTEIGGKASHAAILARALGIPAVTGLNRFDELAKRGGSTLIVDGRDGTVVIDPSPETLERYRKRGQAFDRIRASLAAGPSLPGQTRDEVPVELLINVENPGDVLPDRLDGLAGIGLYRTEFIYMNRPFFPSEDEQLAVYQQVLKRAGGREVVFRTIDVGGDKPLPYFRVDREDNPALGWRGFRISDQWPDLFIAQMRALLRASAYGNVKIMLPMISTVEEVRRAQAIVQDLKSDLKRRGTPIAPKVQVGVMVEVPAAAIAIESLLREADFVSIGSNDLIQYLMAVDRNNARVASLYQELNPSVLKVIANVIRAANRVGKEVSLCGEMAGNFYCTLVLLGLGLRRFSMARHYLTGVGRLLRAVSIDEAEAAARRALNFYTTGEVKAFLGARTRDIFSSIGVTIDESDLE